MWNKIGNIISWLIVIMVMWAFAYSLISFMLYGTMPSPYGARGNIYMYDQY